MHIGQAFIQDPRETLERIGPRRLRLGLLGAACLLLGVVAVLSPLRMFGSVLKVVGALLLGSGALKLLHLVPGRGRRDGLERGWWVLLSEAALDVALGMLLLRHMTISVTILASALGLLFVVDGLVLIVMALRSPTARSRLSLWLTGLITAALGLCIAIGLDQASIEWAGVLVGLKLMLFGSALLWIAASARSSESPLLLEAAPPVEPVVGELYAVYFGTAFHLGVYTGPDRVVHYTDANVVSQVSWDRFLNGRTPMHREYPDLPPVPCEEVVRLAESRVGEQSKYSLLRNNCEHFAIECKSGGTTRYSKYAQIPVSLENAANYPWMGTAVELYTRVVEWLAYNLGGTFGKRLALRVRYIGGLLAAWMLTRRIQASREPSNQAATPSVGCPDGRGKG